MSIPSNTFCWHAISTDVDAGSDFYPSVLNWRIEADPSGTMFVGAGGPVAHIQPPEGGPAAWCSFLSVDDLDAATARAAEHGSHVIVPPTDLPVGRFSVITTPSGAAFGLYQPEAGDTLAEPGPGSVRTIELQSTTPDAELAWFTTVFGAAPEMTVTPSPTDRSQFVAWVEVGDLEATLARVAAQGGTVVRTDTGQDRRAVVADPGGAAFGLVASQG